MRLYPPPAMLHSWSQRGEPCSTGRLCPPRIKSIPGTTGYSIGGLGADYVVEIAGKEGSILSSWASGFNGTTPGEWSWTSLGSAPWAKDQSQMEAELPGVVVTNASRAFIQLRGWGDGGDDGGAFRPAFVASYGLMYSAGTGVDPT